MFKTVSLILLAAAPASSHVGVSPPDAPSGGRFTGAFRIPHGCDGGSTDRVTIEIPEMMDADGVSRPLISVKPEMPSGRWDITIEMRTLDTPVEYHGTVSETVSKIVWNLADGAVALPTHMYEFFGVSFKVPAVPPGRYPFNVRQDCLNSDGTGEGFLDWSNTTEGAKRPPPNLIVTEAQDDGHGSHSAMGDDPDSEDGNTAHTPGHYSNHGEAMEAFNMDHSMMLESEKSTMDVNRGLGVASLVVAIGALLLAAYGVLKGNSSGAEEVSRMEQSKV